MKQHQLVVAVLLLVSIACGDQKGKSRAHMVAMPSEVPATGAWQIKRSHSPMEDLPSVTASLDATDSIEIWPNRRVTPTLLIRCKDGAMDAYVHTGVSANPELGKFQTASGRIRFDAEDPQTLDLGTSTSDDALFFDDPPGILKAVVEHKLLAFEFTPFRSSPAVVTFNLSGAREMSRVIESDCKAQVDHGAAIAQKRLDARLSSALERTRKIAAENGITVTDTAPPAPRSTRKIIGYTQRVIMVPGYVAFDRAHREFHIFGCKSVTPEMEKVNLRTLQVQDVPRNPDCANLPLPYEPRTVQDPVYETANQTPSKPQP